MSPSPFPPSLTGGGKHIFWVTAGAGSRSSLFRPLPLTPRYIQHQQLSASRKTLSLFVCYDTPLPPLPSLPLPLFFIPPSPASHLSLSPSLSLSFSPHLSPPLLRVSGRLFFLCLLLMKGRTKLPSLCPCVVGKFTSLFVSFFSFHPSVAASVLHVSSKSASRSGRLRGGLYLHLCILHWTCL